MALQGIICVITFTTDKLEVAYNMVFLFIGCSTPFSGVLVSFTDIPALFRWLYWVAVPSLAQRALIVSNLQSESLSVPCSVLQHQLLETGASLLGTPQLLHLQAVGGNSTLLCPLGSNETVPVGVVLLRQLNFNSDRTDVNVLVLFCVAIVSRVLAFYVHKGRQYFTDRLQYVQPGGAGSDSDVGNGSAGGRGRSSTVTVRPTTPKTMHLGLSDMSHGPPPVASSALTQNLAQPLLAAGGSSAPG